MPKEPVVQSSCSFFLLIEPLPSFGTEFVWIAALLGGRRIHPEAAVNAVI